MTIDDKLIPQEVKEQCDSAIRKLEQDNQNIRVLQRRLEAFIVDEELSSESYWTLKEQMYDYLTVTSAMVSANDLDLEDFRSLKELVGEEDLEGAVILPAMDRAWTDINTFFDQSTEYARKSQSHAMTPMGTWYGEVAVYYGARAAIAERKHQHWREQEEKFDGINGSTCHLFTRSLPLREAAKKGLESIAGAFQEGTYVVNQEASWRTEIDQAGLAVIQSVKESFLTHNSDGETVCDWKRIETWLSGNPDEVSEFEYLAFADLMAGMTPSELQVLFAKAQMNVIPLDNTGCDVSGVMKEAAERYLSIAQMEAEFTIFNGRSRNSYSEVAVTNELSKAVLIRQVVSGMTESGAGRRHDVSLTAAEDSRGRIIYTAELTVRAGRNGGMGDSIAADMQGRTITVNPWGSTEAAEWDLEEHQKTVFLSLRPSGEGILGKAGGDHMVDYVMGRLGEMMGETVSVPVSAGLSAVELGLELKEGYENAVAIDGAVDSIDMERRLRALGIRTGIVVTTGASESTVTVICPKYDPEELLVRVTVYNQEHEEPITVEELKDGFENGGQVFEDYMQWYSEGADDAFSEYWDELERVLADYKLEHTEVSMKIVSDMNTEQLQELINKYNNPDYEINAAIMGESK